MLNLNDVGICIWIDELVPCLKDTETGEVKETVVFKVESRKYLRKFKKKDGWHINWNEVPNDTDVYALALKDNNEIQGLIAVRNDTEAKAAYIHWGCVAPHNNKHDFGMQKYSGVGNHLFAIAVDKSMQWGYGGMVYSFAANRELLNHYIETLHAVHIGILHEYHFMVQEADAQKILEVYHYEWHEPEEAEVFNKRDGE